MGRGRLRRAAGHGPRRAEALLRSRPAITVRSTVAYAAAWLVGLAVAAVAANTVEDTGNWEDLAAAVLGFLGGTLAGHIAWAVLLVRMLRPLGRRGRAGVVIVVTPILVVAVGLVLAGLFPLIAIALCCIPAALTWWAADPSVPGPTAVA